MTLSNPKTTDFLDGRNLETSLTNPMIFSGKLGSVPALDEAAEPQEAPLFV